MNNTQIYKVQNRIQVSLVAYQAKTRVFGI